MFFPRGRYFVAALALALPLQGFAAEAIPSAAVPGPVDLSVGREARAALARAEPWLEQYQDADAAVQEQETPNEDFAPYLPFLIGEIPADTDDLYKAFYALAVGLAYQNQPLVFVRDDLPVVWKEALLRQIVIRQKIDGQGRGFWRNPQAATTDTEDAVVSTRYAARTISLLLSLP